MRRLSYTESRWEGGMDSKCVILLEDEADLAQLVRDLLEDAGFLVVHCTSIEATLVEAARKSPCVALLDSTNPKEFDLWFLGPRLLEMGVPAIAFTAHATARQQFEADSSGFVGVLDKPFDADEFVSVVEAICWDADEVAS